MINIFPAIERRFNADQEVVRRCRKIYEGFAGDRPDAVMPYVEIHVTDGDPDFDTFSTDVERAAVQVTLFSQGESTRNIHRMTEAFTRLFDDAKLVGADYVSAAFKRTNNSGPLMIPEEGVWRVLLAYEWIGEYVAQTPAVRFA